MEEIESDLNLLACCVFLAIEPVAIQEKAGILEYDCGMSRNEANQAALVLEMKSRDRRRSARFCRDFFDAAGKEMAIEIATGRARVKTISALAARMAGKINARV